jgi:hypothetical protein
VGAMLRLRESDHADYDAPRGSTMQAPSGGWLADVSKQM